jgi:hypothetical protein
VSCERNGKKAGLAGVKAGLPAAGSKIGHVAGAMMVRAKSLPQRAGEADLSGGIDRAIDRAGRAVARPATAVLNFSRNEEKKRAVRSLLATDSGIRQAAVTVLAARWSGKEIGPGQVKGISKEIERQAEKAPATGRRRLSFRRRARNAVLGAVSATIAGRLAEATRVAETGTVTLRKHRFFLPESQEQVAAVWKSHLTGMLNRLDVIGSIKSKNIAKSEGLMIKMKDKTWHRGTVVVKMPAGKRTISHLQSLKTPAEHHFFERKISGEQAAGIAGGQVEPEAVPGYVGSISEKESLSPAWAHAKRAMILTRLHWPPKEKIK